MAASVDWYTTKKNQVLDQEAPNVLHNLERLS